MVTPSPLVPSYVTGCLRRTHLSFISWVFLVLPVNYLNPISVVLHALRIPSPWQPLRIPAQFFPLDFLWSSDLGRLGLSFLPFVSWALRPFHGFWASNLLGLPSFPLVVSSTLLSLLSIRLTHCAIYLGLGVYDFLDLNREFPFFSNVMHLGHPWSWMTYSGWCW